MSYLLFILIGYMMLAIAPIAGMNGVDNTTWICVAILTAGEIISLRCKK